MAKNDPTDTGGLFIGRRPGTGPLRYRSEPALGSPARQRMDRVLAAGILALEILFCLTLWGPQPMAWLWVGSQVDYETGSVSIGILTAFTGMLITLFGTLVIVKRLDYAWKVLRRAGGHKQKEGMLERIFVVSLGIAATLFVFWFLVIQGPGPSLAPQD